MNLPPQNPTPRDPFEAIVTRTLGAQPPRRAPRSLEGRVLAELSRRAALPWWHKSYAYWPTAVRGGFFVLSALAAAALIAGLFMISHGVAPLQLADELADRVTGFAFARQLCTTAADTARVVWRAIPPLWLYGGAAFLAVTYATLVGVSAAAYRAFFAPRSS